ncbi:MAG: hypothetical protein L0206_08750 [Actinobacteria bacterium]|nr:hypothetical protein [Actinomycetota bacterium]
MARGSRRVRPLSRPVHHVLTEDEVSEILARIQVRFAWPETAERFEIAGRWGSRTASLYRCRGASTGRPDVMLKVGLDWTPEVARSVHEAMDELERTLRVQGPVAVGVPAALGWGDEPPLVCSGYVEGTDLYFLLRDLEHPGWSASVHSPGEILEACGRALGAYHARFAPPPNDTEARAQAIQSLERAARTMAVRRAAVERVADGLVIARGFGDVGPHQFRVREPDGLYLLDPPVAETFEPVHRDIARFLFGVARTLGRDARDRARQGGNEPSLRAAFLRGYRESGPTDPTDPRGRWLVRVFEGAAAAGMAHKRLHNRELVSAARYAWGWIGSLIAIRTTTRSG